MEVANAVYHWGPKYSMPAFPPCELRPTVSKGRAIGAVAVDESGMQSSRLVRWPDAKGRHVSLKRMGARFAIGALSLCGRGAGGPNECQCFPLCELRPGLSKSRAVGAMVADKVREPFFAIPQLARRKRP